MRKMYKLFLFCVILFMIIGCSNGSMLNDVNEVGNETTEEYYGGSVDFRLTRMIAENYLMENMDHYDWVGAEIGDFYPLYNPATDKITYLEYKVTKEGKDRGYILVTLKDDETGVVESSHGENGTCYELLRDRAGTSNIKGYRFSFASYVAEYKNVSRAGGRKILAALGNIEYELMDESGAAADITRSKRALGKYEELIGAYKTRVEENDGYLDIKKEYREYLKKQKEDTTRTAPTHKEDKSAEIQWYWDETNVDVTYDSIQLRVLQGYNPNSGIGGTYSVRCYFLNGTYQDITFPLSINSNIRIPLNRNDLLKIESIKFSGYIFGDLSVRLYRMRLNNQLMVYSFGSTNIPYNNWVMWENTTRRIHYPLMRADQFLLSDGVTPCGCVPVAGTMIAAYWDKIKGIDMYPGNITAEGGYINSTNQFIAYANFEECVYRFRDYLNMVDNGAYTWLLGDAFYQYGVERGLFNPCNYEILYNIDGIAVNNAEDWGNLDEYSYNGIIRCLNNNFPPALGYTEEGGGGHSVVIYKLKVYVDNYDNYYNAVFSVDTGWWDTMLKDLNNATYGLKYATLIWR